MIEGMADSTGHFGLQTHEVPWLQWSSVRQVLLHHWGTREVSQLGATVFCGPHSKSAGQRHADKPAVEQTIGVHAFSFCLRFFAPLQLQCDLTLLMRPCRSPKKLVSMSSSFAYAPLHDSIFHCRSPEECFRPSEVG